jgi:hypothetical protein
MATTEPDAQEHSTGVQRLPHRSHQRHHSGWQRPVFDADAMGPDPEMVEQVTQRTSRDL